VTGRPSTVVTYHTFPGNLSEGKTLLKIVQELKEGHRVKEVTLVADRAMFTEENLKTMEALGVKYVVASKLKRLPKTMKEAILTDICYQPQLVSNELCWVKEYRFNGRRLIVNYSSSRAKKDKSDRQRLVDRLMKKKKSGKIKIKDLINNNGTKKYIEVKGENQVEVNFAKIQEDSRWDGISGVITNIEEKNATKILERYRSLWNIEAAFRLNKHDLSIRPIYHWKPSRIRAHLMICFLAYSLTTFVLYRLREKGLKISFRDLREEMNKTESSIVIDQSTGKKYIIPSKVTDRQKDIYQSLGYSRKAAPYSGESIRSSSLFFRDLK